MLPINIVLRVCHVELRADGYQCAEEMLCEGLDRKSNIPDNLDGVLVYKHD